MEVVGLMMNRNSTEQEKRQIERGWHMYYDVKPEKVNTNLYQFLALNK